ncbi:MAG: glycosyltransferase family 4 protein, partial [Acidimicrobiia bacterium]|nr:glycosyltransferase family 4 protein [Acidimicrobiia bacterium]
MANPNVRAAMIIQNYLPTVGGAERQLASLIPLLSEQGIESVVLTRSRPGQPAREFVRCAEIRRVRCVGPKPVQSIMFVIGTLWNLARLRPDVVHGYDTLTPSLIAGLYKSVTGTPYLTKLLRSGELGDLRRLEIKPLGSLRLRLLKWTVDRFVVISHDLERELESRDVGSERRVFIPNGVDTDRFRPPDGTDEHGSPPDPAERRRLRQRELPDWPDGPVALVVGRISPEKRVIDLARRWPDVRAEHPDAWLYVIGEGPLEHELDGLTGVRLLGKREDVPLLLRW